MQRLRFGVTLSGLQLQECGGDLHQRVRDIIRVVHHARELGYHYIAVGQHYLTHPFQQLQPLPLLSLLVNESDNMRLVATVIAPLHNPVELAESFATLDQMSRGRAVLTLALGYRDVEYEAFGVSRRLRVRKLEEVVQGVRALWETGELCIGGVESGATVLRTGIRPFQRPRPPIWIAASSDAAIARAARWGLPWRINGHTTQTEVARQVALFRAAYHPREDAHRVTLPMGRELYCAPTRAEALDDAGPYLAANYNVRYASWGQDKAYPGDVDFKARLDDLRNDRFLIGSPDECAHDVARYAALGIDSMAFRMGWPGLPIEKTLDSLTLFAREVMPRFEGQR